MREDLKAYLQTPEHTTDDLDYAQLQRLALAEALHLSTAHVHPLMSRLKSDYETTQQEIEKRFDQDKHMVDACTRPQMEESEKQYRARVQNIEANHQRRLQQVVTELEQKREKVNSTVAAGEKKARNDFREKTMEIEFVAESAVENVKKQQRDQENHTRSLRTHLQGLLDRADELTRVYRQAPWARAEQSELGGPDMDDPEHQLKTNQSRAEETLAAFENLSTAQVFVGMRPVLFGLTLGAVPWLVLVFLNMQQQDLPPIRVTGPVATGLGLVLAGILGYALWHKSKRRIRQLHQTLDQAVGQAQGALAQCHALALQQLEKQSLQAAQDKKQELNQAQQGRESTLERLQQHLHQTLQDIDEAQTQAQAHLAHRRTTTLQEAQEDFKGHYALFEHQMKDELDAVQQGHAKEVRQCEDSYATACQALQERWDLGLAQIQALVQATQELDKKRVGDWDRVLTDDWTPPTHSGPIIRIGTVGLDMQQLDEAVRAQAPADLQQANTLSLPAPLAFPEQGSLFLECDRDGRAQALEILRAVMMRIFTSLPPGRARFTIIDPIGLGESFAGFMHAGDYQEALIGGRIWTETTQIQQQLEDLTEHMENVIQKYLRNEFDTIEQYNQQAGELAEPYRFLVIADFPTNFNAEAAQRLRSIINSGPRCGVFALIAYDRLQAATDDIEVEDLRSHCVHLLYESGAFVWQDQVLGQFPLSLDAPPDEKTLTRVMHTVGKASIDASRVEVPFQTVAPTEAQFWSLDSRDELSVPLGRTGATRLRNLKLGKGVTQHLLIAGKTGSGKSTLLHVMITNLALWYGPDQVELYLIDFKKGVEFKTYVTHDLPHARAIAIESDREFGLSILQRLDAEMTRRGELFRQAGVQDIAAYRNATDQALARTVLIVDEFQIFFSEDDKLAQDAGVLLEQLVRQGRAFGIHVILGSQTLGGAFGLARSTMGQMAVRIALQCSETDSQLILDDDNVAARLLSRPGEAIYNDAGGQVMGNSPFQTAWLPDACREDYLLRMDKRTTQMKDLREAMVVFEGSAPADITENRELRERLQRSPSDSDMHAPQIWLGAPVAIKAPTSITLRRQSGANVLIVGQRDEVALHLLQATLVSLAAQLPREGTRFVILDGSPQGSAHIGQLENVAGLLPQNHQSVGYRQVPEVMTELAQALDQRITEDLHSAAPIFVLVYGLQRYRVLRRSEDAFGFSMDGEDAGPKPPDAQFTHLLREGPGAGVHCLVWADTLATVERSLDRQTLREFDFRVLFQMSATDSSNLIDSPAGNQLGFHRALLYSEEQGGIEKFRPYAAPEEGWVKEMVGPEKG